MRVTAAPALIITAGHGAERAADEPPGNRALLALVYPFNAVVTVALVALAALIHLVLVRVAQRHRALGAHKKIANGHLLSARAAGVGAGFRLGDSSSQRIELWHSPRSMREGGGRGGR